MAIDVVITKLELDADLRACRVCLATDTKLLYLLSHPLAKSYDSLTGTALSEADGLPQHICIVCGSQLLKYSTFRDKCWTANGILQEAISRNLMITTGYIRKIDKKHLKHNLSKTNTQNIDVIPKTEDKNKTVKKKNSRVNTQTDFTLNDDVGHDHQFDDEIVTDDDANSKQNTTSVVKIDIDDFYSEKKVICDSYEEINDDLLPDSSIEIGESIFEDSKKFLIEMDGIAFASNLEMANVAPDTKPKRMKREKKGKLAKRVVKNKKKKNTQMVKQEKEDAQDKDMKERKRERNGKLKYRSKEEMVNESEAYNVDVVMLTKDEQRQRIEARKETLIYKNSKFNCQVCFLSFSEEFAFNNHMIVHDPRSGDYVCDICQYHFPDKKKYGNHCRLHRMSLICRECNKVSRTVPEAKEHYNWHRGVKFECELCGIFFTKLKSKVTHNRNFHGSTPCGICGDNVIGERGLLLHMQKCHEEALKAVCSTCSQRFHSMEALSKHVCLPGMMPCAQCGDSFSTEELLRDHSQERHVKEFKCVECKETFRNERLYTLHCHRVHHTTVRSTDPRRPMQRRHLKHKYNYMCMCEVCGLYLQSPSALKSHQRTHTGEKPFQCDHCTKSFRLKEQLQYHINIHTGERPYKCQNCPKAFRSATVLHRHRLIHSKERPHACHLCGKAFQTTTCVKLHVRKVHMKATMPRSTKNKS